MPRGRERAGLGLAVAYHARDDELRVVERRAVGMREAVTELAALVNRARRLWRHVRADVTRERELLEEFLHALDVFALVGIDLGVRAFEVRGPEHAGRAMTRPGDEDHVEVVTLDDAIQVRPHERQRWACSPVAEEPLLDVFRLQGHLQQRIVLHVDHAD
jgi:hypothetical protein